MRAERVEQLDRRTGCGVDRPIERCAEIGGFLGDFREHASPWRAPDRDASPRRAAETTRGGDRAAPRARPRRRRARARSAAASRASDSDRRCAARATCRRVAPADRRPRSDRARRPRRRLRPRRARTATRRPRGGGRACARRRRAARGSTPPTRAACAGVPSPCARRRSAAGSGRRAPSASRSTESARTRAAASSSASGMPSRRRQMRATGGRGGGVEREARAAPRARARRRAAPRRSRRRDPDRARLRPGSASEGMRQVISPAAPSGSRLVASTRTPAPARSSGVGQLGAGAEQMLAVVEHEQQLDAREVAHQHVERADAGDLVRRRTPPRRRPATCVSEASRASSTQTTPSAKRSPRSSATACARRVLPEPPAPVMRDEARRRRSAWRPRAARARARRAASARAAASQPERRSAVKSLGRSGWQSWWTRSGRSKPASATRLQLDAASRHRAAARSTSAAVALDTRTCPPCASERSRAQRISARPP